MTTAAEWVAFLEARLDENAEVAAYDGYAWSGHVEALRAILAEHAENPDVEGTCRRCKSGLAVPCPTVRAIAKIPSFSGHPDYPQD